MFSSWFMIRILFILTQSSVFSHKTIIPFDSTWNCLTGPTCFLLPLVRPQLCPLQETLQSWCHCHMPSLCHLSVDCWHVVCFCFSFQFFSCTAPHWRGTLHPPCQFQYVPRTLLPHFHSVSSAITFPFHPPCHARALSDWFLALQAAIQRF